MLKDEVLRLAKTLGKVDMVTKAHDSLVNANKQIDDGYAWEMALSMIEHHSKRVFTREELNLSV